MIRTVDVDDRLAAFVDSGIVRLDQAFSLQAANRMRDAVWRYVEPKAGVSPHDRATWPDGWLPVSWKGLRHNPVFDAIIDNPWVPAMLDSIFERTGWKRPNSGAQVLFNLPRTGPWTLHNGWHMDCGFEQPTWPVPAVKLFSFFGDVGPYGGGTMLLAGCHRLVDLYRSTFDVPPAAGNSNWHSFLRRYPPLGNLLKGATLPDLGRPMVGERFQIEGIPIEVVELTGRPGDVVITHLHVFHCTSPNASNAPRQMLGKAVVAA
jgi:hypothetical protein